MSHETKKLWMELVGKKIINPPVEHIPHTQGFPPHDISVMGSYDNE